MIDMNFMGSLKSPFPCNIHCNLYKIPLYSASIGYKNTAGSAQMNVERQLRDADRDPTQAIPET